MAAVRSVFFFLICFVFFLADCSVRSYSDHYKVYIDPAFAERIKPVIEGIEEWTYVSNGQFTFDIEFANVDYPWNDDEIVIHPVLIKHNIGPDNGPALGLTHTVNSWGSYYPKAIIHLSLDDQNADDTALRRVSAHEIGHALGIHRHTSPGTIMYIMLDNMSQHVTCLDVQHEREMRGDSQIDCTEFVDQ